jgi:hypothetical protein
MRKYLYGVVAFVLAFVILSVSVLRSCSITSAYGYTDPTPPAATPSDTITPTPIPTIDYVLPYPGAILPDNLLWYFKAARDKLQYLITTDPLKKADLALLFSDKRLGASVTLFQEKKPDLAASTLTKGEKYLEESMNDEIVAKKAGINTNDFLIKLANASLKHRQVIEEQIMPLAPEDIKPEIVQAEDYAKNTYKTCSDILSSEGITPPKDPFNGQ